MSGNGRTYGEVMYEGAALKGLSSSRPLYCREGRAQIASKVTIFQLGLRPVLSRQRKERYKIPTGMMARSFWRSSTASRQIRTSAGKSACDLLVFRTGLSFRALALVRQKTVELCKGGTGVIRPLWFRGSESFRRSAIWSKAYPIVFEEDQKLVGAEYWEWGLLFA